MSYVVECWQEDAGWVMDIIDENGDPADVSMAFPSSGAARRAFEMLGRAEFRIVNEPTRVEARRDAPVEEPPAGEEGEQAEAGEGAGE